MIRRTFMALAGVAVAAAFITTPALAQDKKIVIATPGIPPIYSITLVYVAEKQGFFKKHGADVEIRPFDNGTAAARFMQDPKNADTVAEIATVTGHSKEVSKLALQEFLKIDFWAAKDDGLPRKKIEAVAALMKKIGAIKPDKEPVTYDALVDTSVYKDANAMVK